MTRTIPATSRKPFDPPMAMSTAPPEATPSPVPRQVSADTQDNTNTNDSTLTERERPTPKLPTPKLRFHVEEVLHEGASLFFKHIVAANALTDAVSIVQQQLYRSRADMPAVRSITLVLKPFDGVAYTRGMDLDDEHKEIHFSLDYIAGLLESDRAKDEIVGVLVHEMVHVWQWNGRGTCPGGLIEGFADFVRLRAGLDPPHWKREKGDDWDSGYERTAYFLDWLQKTHDVHTVRKMNIALKDEKYDEEKFWHRLFGTSVDKLWQRYQEQFAE